MAYQFGSTKGRKVIKALERMGWYCRNATGSHKVFVKPNHSNYVFSHSDNEEIGPRMLSKIAKETGLTPSLL